MLYKKDIYILSLLIFFFLILLIILDIEYMDDPKDNLLPATNTLIQSKSLISTIQPSSRETPHLENKNLAANFTKIIPSFTSQYIESTSTPTNAPHYLYTYQIINTFHHDPNVFTEGFFINNGYLYESSGLYGKSKLLKRELSSGDIILEKSISEQYFAEGLTVIRDRLFMLTWQSNLGFILSSSDFELIENFPIDGEGWGLTFDGRYLILSNGSSYLNFLDPETFTKQFQIYVTDNNIPVALLNELEYINGKIYANIWESSRIAIIEPSNGNVISWIVLDGIEQVMDRSIPIDVLNGIAYDKDSNRLFVTGKYWPNIFEIKLIPYH
jgi:glutamine cyclotransferase